MCAILILESRQQVTFPKVNLMDGIIEEWSAMWNSLCRLAFFVSFTFYFFCVCVLVKEVKIMTPTNMFYLIFSKRSYSGTFNLIQWCI